MNKLQIGNFILNIFPDFEERLRDWIIKSDLTEREKYVLIQRIFNEKTLEKEKYLPLPTWENETINRAFSENGKADDDHRTAQS